MRSFSHTSTPVAPTTARRKSAESGSGRLATTTSSSKHGSVEIGLPSPPRGAGAIGAVPSSAAALHIADDSVSSGSSQHQHHLSQVAAGMLQSPPSPEPALPPASAASRPPLPPQPLPLPPVAAVLPPLPPQSLPLPQFLPPPPPSASPLPEHSPYAAVPIPTSLRSDRSEGVASVKETVNSAIAELQLALQEELHEDQLRIHRVLGRGGFGVVYHGASPPAAPPPPTPLQMATSLVCNGMWIRSCGQYL
jgi:hypothetical protein